MAQPKPTQLPFRLLTLESTPELLKLIDKKRQRKKEERLRRRDLKPAPNQLTLFPPFPNPE